MIVQLMNRETDEGSTSHVILYDNVHEVAYSDANPISIDLKKGPGDCFGHGLQQEIGMIVDYGRVLSMDELHSGNYLTKTKRISIGMGIIGSLYDGEEHPTEEVFWKRLCEEACKGQFRSEFFYNLLLFRIKGSPELYVVRSTQEIYLLNDNGKTLRRIRLDAHGDPNSGLLDLIDRESRNWFGKEKYA